MLGVSCNGDEGDCEIERGYEEKEKKWRDFVSRLSRVERARQELHSKPFFDLWTVLAEIAFGCERPMKVPHHPVFKALNVLADVVIDVAAVVEGRESSFSVDEAIDTASAKLADVINRFLHYQALLLHDNDDHVVRVTTRLLDVVGKDVLMIKIPGGIDQRK